MYQPKVPDHVHRQNGGKLSLFAHCAPRSEGNRRTIGWATPLVEREAVRDSFRVAEPGVN